MTRDSGECSRNSNRRRDGSWQYPFFRIYEMTLLNTHLFIIYAETGIYNQSNFLFNGRSDQTRKLRPPTDETRGRHVSHVAASGQGHRGKKRTVRGRSQVARAVHIRTLGNFESRNSGNFQGGAMQPGAQLFDRRLLGINQR